MKYFLDTEFIENGQTIDLISIGIVAENGRELYQCNQDADLNKADEWVIWNVYPSLPVKHSVYGWYWNAPKIGISCRADSKSVVIPHHEIRDRVRAFIGDDPSPEFWAYYADYDWVAFCQLFGRMMDLPEGWPKYCNDLKQLAVSMSAELPKTDSRHNALDDAQWVQRMVLKLT